MIEMPVPVTSPVRVIVSALALALTGKSSPLVPMLAGKTPASKLVTVMVIYAADWLTVTGIGPFAAQRSTIAPVVSVA